MVSEGGLELSRSLSGLVRAGPEIPEEVRQFGSVEGLPGVVVRTRPEESVTKLVTTELPATRCGASSG